MTVLHELITKFQLATAYDRAHYFTISTDLQNDQAQQLLCWLDYVVPHISVLTPNAFHMLEEAQGL